MYQGPGIYRKDGKQYCVLGTAKHTVSGDYLVLYMLMHQEKDVFKVTPIPHFNNEGFECLKLSA